MLKVRDKSEPLFIKLGSRILVIYNDILAIWISLWKMYISTTFQIFGKISKILLQSPNHQYI